MANQNSFEINGVRKQEEAYKESFAKRQFEYSCAKCCYNNLRGGKEGCSNCPIKEAHINALIRIRSEKSEPVKYGAKKKYNRNGSVTIVINFHD